MDFLELAKKRCSVRNFEPRNVEPEKVAKIIEAARVAPTAANLQPVRLIVAQDAAALAKVSAGANIYGAPLAIIACADRTRAWRRPHDGKQTTDIDASILTDHMMLEATVLGLGSVWICWFDPEIISREFALPDHMEPINILAIGYSAVPPANPARHATERISAEELVI